MSDEFVKLLRNSAFAADATDRKLINEAADRIEHLHSMAVLDGDEIAKWREIVSGRTIGENYEAVWRERLKQSEAREAALNLKLAKAVDALVRIEEASQHFSQPEMPELSCRYAHETTRRLASATLAALKGQNDG